MANVSHSPLQVWKPLLIQLRQTGAQAGVDLKVRHSDRTLHLLLEGASFSSRKEWVSQIQGLLETHPVQFTATDQILIYGRIKGKRYPAWKATIPLAHSSSEAVENSPPARKSWLSVQASRPLQPAISGLKDVLSSSDRSLSQGPALPRMNPDITAQLVPLSSQQWLARLILGLFLLGLMLYLYIGTWFIPQQGQKWDKLQSDLERITTVQPRNLEEIESLNQDLEETIAQLKTFSPLSGPLYQRARARLQSLQDRQEQLQYRQQIEQQGQVYLGEAKRLAAEATLMLETDGDKFPLTDNPTTRETEAVTYWRSVQHRWLVALYWLNQVPGQTFAAQERYSLISQYQKTYWQIYQNAEISPEFATESEKI
ncbi:MAG: hypothetical protein ACO31I_03080 [Prochlorotrichaceae cyanobacterium]|jgi:cell division protein FtsB